MSLSALEKKQVHIDCELRSWRFSINSQMLSLKDLNKFKETVEKSVTCTFLWAVLKLLTVRLQGTATASSIPQAYADYADVFSESEAECLSAHKKHDYVIDNNEKNSSHSPLYNLSGKELQVLQSYLNDILWSYSSLVMRHANYAANNATITRGFSVQNNLAVADN